MDQEVSNEIGKDHNVTIERYVMPEQSIDDAITESAPNNQIRPSFFDEYPGQTRVKENLRVYVGACSLRKQALDHVILHGPPGLGKTTLARIIANELGVPFYQTSGPSISKPGDLAGILTGIEPRGVLFIDEIHRLSIEVEEVLYPAMEDFFFDFMVGQGQTARMMRMPLNPFTLIGATTRVASLSNPLLMRFGIEERLEYYDHESLATILKRSATIWDIELEPQGAEELASRSRGTPRIANRLLRRACDFAAFQGINIINRDIVAHTLNRLGIDNMGLDKMDRLILSTIRDQYEGGPVGLDTLAATIGEEKSTIEDVYEPYLLLHGLLLRTPRGRKLSRKGEAHIRRFSDG